MCGPGEKEQPLVAPPTSSLLTHTQAGLGSPGLGSALAGVPEFPALFITAPDSHYSGSTLNPSRPSARRPALPPPQELKPPLPAPLAAFPHDTETRDPHICVSRGVPVCLLEAACWGLRVPRQCLGAGSAFFSRQRPPPHRDRRGIIWAGGLLRVGSHTPPPASDIHPPQKARARQQTHSPRGPALCFVSQAPSSRGHLGSSPQGGQGGPPPPPGCL